MSKHYSIILLYKKTMICFFPEIGQLFYLWVNTKTYMVLGINNHTFSIKNTILFIRGKRNPK